MASHRVLQYVAGAKKKPPTVYLHCHVKPGASKVREGITALTESTIELCVSAVPKDGESNKAVLAVLSEVSPSRSPQSSSAPRPLPSCLRPHAVYTFGVIAFGCKSHPQQEN